MLCVLRHLVVLFALVLVLAAPPAIAGECTAGPFVTAAGRALLSAAHSRSPARLSAAASRYGDVHALALFALGPYRKGLPPAREGEYVSLTRNFMGQFLSRYADRVSGSNLSVVSCTGGDKSPTVTAKITGGGKVIFRLYKTRRGYLMRDVNIGGVWLGGQMRASFTSILQKNRGEMSALFAYLR